MDDLPNTHSSLFSVLHSSLPDVSVSIHSHTPESDFDVTTDSKFIVDTFTASPEVYPESLTTEGEVLGNFGTREPFGTTLETPISFPPTIEEAWIDVATSQPDLDSKRLKENSSTGR